MEILCGEDLSFSYANSEAEAVSRLNFKINKGEFVVIMGESGCGKSTLLKLIKKELLPAGITKGSLLYKGKPIEEAVESELTADIGFVMQNVDAQIVTDRVYHELAFVLESLSYSTDEIRLKVGEMAGYFGIERLFRRKTDELSGGEKQLINLASVMVTNPELLLLDEPTSKLDPIAAGEFIATLQKINTELGTTIILVEHRLEEVFSIADKILLMEEGRIIAADTPGNVGKFLINHKMLAGAPKSVALYREVPVLSCNCPLNVKEGKAYIKENFSNGKNVYVNKEAETEENPVVELKDIWFRYEKEERDILRSVNLKVNRGEVFSLLGGNGAGKTTLFSIMCGLKRPYRGKVYIDKKDIRKYKGNQLYNGKISMLPQEPVNVFFKTEIYDDYMEILDSTLSREKKEKRIEEVAEILNIGHLMKKHPYDLSGGELQKCAIGKILLKAPEIMLLDEPTKGIDGCGKKELVNIIRTLKERGVTVVMVTHDVEFAAEVSDRCGMLFDGEIIAAATPHKFFCRNNFYTTAVNRMAKNIYENVIRLEELVCLIKENM